MDDYPVYLQKKLHLEIEIGLVKKNLILNGLLTENATGYLLFITTEGEKALKMGYKGYKRYLEKKEKDKEAKDHRDAVLSKWQIIIFWPLFAFAFAGFILSVFNLLKK